MKNSCRLLIDPHIKRLIREKQRMKADQERWRKVYLQINKLKGEV